MWDVFISHAWEDKEDIARPLADALRRAGLRVWYDEFTLTLGDSLRRSIDRGLAQSRYGVVILSPHFFKKEWPKRELDGLVTKEVSSGKTILPVWHNVTWKDVRRFSPTLADKLAVSTAKGLDAVVEEILRALRVPSPLVRPTPAQPRRPVNWERAGAIAGVIAVFIALGAWSVLNVVDILSNWLATPTATPTKTPTIVAAVTKPPTDMPTVTPTSSVIHTPAPTATDKPTNTPTNTSVPPTDTPTPVPPTDTPLPPTPTTTHTPTLTPTLTPTPTIDTQEWQVFENGGNIVPLYPGFRLEQQEISNQFPFLISRENPFPATGDFEVEIRFRYSSVGRCGTGISIGSCCPQNGQSATRYPELLLQIWQDSRGFLIVKWNYTGQPDEIFFQGEGNTSLTEHQAVIRYSADNNITVSIDGDEITSFVAARRPERIWLGNPVSVTRSGLWSALEVRSIKVITQ